MKFTLQLLASANIITIIETPYFTLHAKFKVDTDIWIHKNEDKSDVRS